ncbi:MAG: hypothetical protein IJ174_09010 [Clostridia bacterium]|nr:hypothetical protein [Clostridia bacterium]
MEKKEGEAMRFGRMNTFITLVMAASMLFSNGTAQDDPIKQFMEDSLTEVYGYTLEELDDFAFETREDGSVVCWPKDHPNWVYTAFNDRASGGIKTTTPFSTGYLGYCGEGAVWELLREIRERNWISGWNEDSKAALLDACLENNVSISTEMYLADTAAQALQAFFESCYGPAAGWTDTLTELRDSISSEYGLTVEYASFHVPGVRRCGRSQNRYQSDLLRTYTLFDGGAYPDELKEAFSDPHLSGWSCQSGALMYDEMKENPRTGTGSGLAAFEKDGKRQLVQLNCMDGQWMVYPLGTNALYPAGDYRVTFDTQHNAFAVQYRLSDEETAAFYLFPNQSKHGQDTLFYTTIESYERVNRKTGEAIWINVSQSGMPTWQKELMPDGLHDPIVNFPSHLGVVPITDFPTTLEAARQYTFPGMPEGYVYTVGVNLRAQRNSRSHSHGMLNAGTLLPVLERLPGDPSEWIRTRVGFLEGFVVETYVRDGQTQSGRLSALPVVEAQKEIQLKKGTGFFDGTLQTLPGGTKMHVIIDNGDWLYVDVPHGDIQFLMDVDGTFGYVRRADVSFLPLLVGVDWAE